MRHDHHSHPHQVRSRFGDDFGQFVSDAANTAGKIAADPGAAINGAANIVTHPEDDFNAIVKQGPDQLIKALKIYGSFYEDIFKAVQDAAKSKIGRQLLDVASGAAYMAAVVSTGPFALLIFSAPGLLRGEDFAHAWLEGAFANATRALKALSGGSIDINVLPPEITDQMTEAMTEYTSQIGDAQQVLQDYDPETSAAIQSLGVPTDASGVISGQVTPMVQKQIDALKAQAQQKLQDMGLPADPSQVTPEMLASKLNIRLDSATAALAAFTKDPKWMNQWTNTDWDLRTGKLAKVAAVEAFDNAQLAKYRTLGFNAAQSNKLLQAGRLMGNNPDYTNGFDTGFGMMTQYSTNEAEYLRTKSLLPNVAARNGFDAAVAMWRAQHIVKAKGGISRLAHMGISAKAGYMMTRGIAGARPAQISGVVGTVAKVPQAREGAATALQHIAQEKGVSESWWHKLLAFFGLA